MLAAKVVRDGATPFVHDGQEGGEEANDDDEEGGGGGGGKEGPGIIQKSLEPAKFGRPMLGVGRHNPERAIKGSTQIRNRVG